MSPARTRRPSPLANMGNPAAAAPDDEPTAAPATSKATPAPAGTAAHEAAQETVQDSESAAAPAKTRARATKRAPAASARSKTTRSNRSTTGAAAAVETPAAETPSSRPGRPRIPKAGPVTRATVDLAQTEQRELERITGVIGRKIGRDSGRKRLQVQHLMRVATRRLISDAAFRDLVAEDLAEHRDELKREK